MTKPSGTDDTSLENRLNNVERRMDYPNSRPRDAATLLVLDRSDRKNPNVLMGRRHERHKFMPGKFVFPGGRVDPADSRARIATDYDAPTKERVLQHMKRVKTETRARALAVAAIRETYEEAGLFIGKRQETDLPGGKDLKAFADHKVALDLAALRFVGRAITPPRRPRRFDTRFFAVFSDAIADRMPDGVLPSGELEDLHWIPLSDARSLDLPTITQVMIEELMHRIDQDPNLSSDRPVPFYFWDRNRFIRTEIGSS